MNHKVAGYYKMEAVKISTGDRRDLTGWFPNIITDGGLDRMATSYDYLNYCQVGTGSTAPSASDTALVSMVGASNGAAAWTAATFSVNSTSPYYRITRIVSRLTPGQATGNLSEVGMGWASTGSLFSRALILDSYGNPTTITVLSDEYLDVTYEYRFYPEESDITGSIILTGNKGGTYNYTLRCAYITYHVLQQKTSFGNVPVTMNNRANSSGVGTIYNRVYDGPIGVLTGIPSGTNEPFSYTCVSVSSYTAGTRTLTLTISLPITVGNLSGGIKSIIFPWGNVHYQIEFDTAILKTSEDTLSLTFTHTWARV